MYYRSIRSYRKRKTTAQQVIELVDTIRIDQPRLGTRKLYYLLKEELKPIGVGRDRLFTILKANHRLIRPKRSYHITTNSYHRFRKHKNLIEDMVPNRPEQVWVADITYLGNRKKPMYLAMITDAYSKKIIGYDVSNSLEASGSIRALKMAYRKREYPNKALIHHSDRGFQYCSDDYQKVLKKSGLRCSMTETYDPYANAIAERVNGIIKQEYRLMDYRQNLKTMQNLVKESIGTYNKKRPHLSCHMLTPEQMHMQSYLNIVTYKNKNRNRPKPIPV